MCCWALCVWRCSFMWLVLFCGSECLFFAGFFFFQEAVFLDMVVPHPHKHQLLNLPANQKGKIPFGWCETRSIFLQTVELGQPMHERRLPQVADWCWADSTPGKGEEAFDMLPQVSVSSGQLCVDFCQHEWNMKSQCGVTAVERTLTVEKCLRSVLQPHKCWNCD